MRLMINGFGRIGRQAFRIAYDQPEVEVVRINDVADAETLAYLLKYDSTYGVWAREVKAENGAVVVDGERFAVSNIKSPGELPHADDGIDVVLESTGIFRKREEAQQHLDAGATKVLISAPAKNAVDGNFIIGVNEDDYDAGRHDIITIGSCTTNCVVPMAKVLHDRFRIEHGWMTTTHAYTSTQNLIDGPQKKVRRGRAAATNIVPTTTGAAEMIGQIIPELDGKVSGMALRVPVECGSITGLVCRVESEASEQAVNEAFREAAAQSMKGVLGIEPAPLVSSDIIGNAHSCVFIPGETAVVEGRLVNVMGWYDNEWGFSARLVDMIKRMI
ncbi:MAG: type I glyceraldehyde-3-phosphate dehydrogenase [Phycisphaeraceae bacterium]